MITELSREQIDEVLRGALYARLGCHADGRTYVVPISFALENDHFVGMTTTGMKVEMMRRNPEVCLCVDEIKDLTHWTSVILWGTFEEVEGVEAAKLSGLLIDKYGPIFEEMRSPARRGRNVTPDRLDGHNAPPVVYRIRITERTGRSELGG